MQQTHTGLILVVPIQAKDSAVISVRMGVFHLSSSAHFPGFRRPLHTRIKSEQDVGFKNLVDPAYRKSTGQRKAGALMRPMKIESSTPRNKLGCIVQANSFLYASLVIVQVRISENMELIDRHGEK